MCGWERRERRERRNRERRCGGGGEPSHQEEGGGPRLSAAPARLHKLLLRLLLDLASALAQLLQETPSVRDGILAAARPASCRPDALVHSRLAESHHRSKLANSALLELFSGTETPVQGSIFVLWYLVDLLDGVFTWLFFNFFFCFYWNF